MAGAAAVAPLSPVHALAMALQRGGQEQQQMSSDRRDAMARELQAGGAFNMPDPYTVASGLPIVGDAISGYEAVQSARQGDWAGAGLNALGMLPLVPAMGSIRLPSSRDGFDILAFKGMPSVGPNGETITDLRKPHVWQSRHIPNARPHGGFFSDDPGVASRFASYFRGAPVYPSHLNMRGAADIDLAGAPARAAQWEKYATEFNRESALRAFVDALQNNPRGAILRNTADEGTIFVPGSGQQIRSVFDYSAR